MCNLRSSNRLHIGAGYSTPQTQISPSSFHLQMSVTVKDFSAEVLICTSSPGLLCHNRAKAPHWTQRMTAFLSSPLGGWFRTLRLSQLSRKFCMIDGASTNSLSKPSIKVAPIASYIYNQTKRFKGEGWSMECIEIWMWNVEQLNIELCSHGLLAGGDEELFYSTTSGLVETSGCTVKQMLWALFSWSPCPGSLPPISLPLTEPTMSQFNFSFK